MNKDGKIKILFSTSTLVPYRVNWLDELGKYADIDVYYLMDDDKERNSEWCATRPKNCKYKLLKSKNIPKLGKVSFEFVKILKKHAKEYDVILLDGYGFLSQMINIRYLNKKKIPYFVNIDGIVPKEEKEKSISLKIKKNLLSKGAYFLCGADESRKELGKYGVSFDRTWHHKFTPLYKSEIISDVVSENQKKAYREKLDIKEKKVIISVGRFSYLNGYGKGYDVLLRAAKKLDKDIGWYIVGGQPTDEFVKLTNESGLLNVHYIDFKKKEELQEYYKASDIFVLMTVSDVWGLVVNEAMACGLPIITTDKCVAGVELVANDVNGFIIPVGAHDELVNKVNYIFENDRQLDMGRASLAKIQDYTIENMAKTHMEIFNKIINDGK